MTILKIPLFCLMKIIDRLTVGQRLMLMTLVFLLPAGVMLWLIAATIDKDISFATYERMGNAYQRPIQKILEAATPYAWAKLEGADASGSEAKINEGFTELMKVQGTYGETLQVTDKGLGSRGREAFDPKKLLARWETLKAEKELKRDDLVSLANDLKGLLLHTGDTSNLILDPDLDSYYLMDVTLLALPQTQNRLMTTQFDVVDLISKTELSNEEKVKKAVVSAMFSDADRARVVGDIDTVLKEDGNFYGISESLKPSLTAAQDTYIKASVAIEDALKGISQGQIISKADFLKLAEDFNRESFAFWHKGVDELDKLLTKRISFFEQKRLTYMSIALLALAVAVGLAFYLSGTIQKVLKNIMNILSSNAALMAQTSGQMQEQAQEVANAAQEQVTSIEKTAAFMEEISSIIKQNEQFASQSRDNALQALKSANEGKGSTEELHKSTVAVDVVLDQMQKAMSDIRQSSESIANILRTIDEIAFQTNILALNAAVEAARAGEAGAGFSVVADEVRKLAQRSATAADETSKLIKASIEKTHTGTEVNNEVSKQLKLIATKTLTVTGTIQRTLDEIAPLEEKMEHLAQAAKEQTSGVNELAGSIHNIDRMSKANLTNSDKLGEAAEFLRRQQEGLNQALQELETLTGNSGKNRALSDKDNMDGNRPLVRPLGQPSKEELKFN